MMGYCVPCRSNVRPGHAATAKHAATMRPPLPPAEPKRYGRHDADAEVEHFRSQVADDYLAQLASVDDGAMLADDFVGEYVGLGWHGPAEPTNFVKAGKTGAKHEYPSKPKPRPDRSKLVCGCGKTFRVNRGSSFTWDGAGKARRTSWISWIWSRSPDASKLRRAPFEAGAIERSAFRLHW